MNVIDALGWTLLHFLWQGALVAAVLAVGLAALRGARPEPRYAASCLGMGLMLAAPPVTFTVLLAADPGSAAPVAAALPLVRAEPALFERLAPIVPQLAMLWIAGVLLFEARLVAQWTAAQRLRTRGAQPAPPAWQDAVAELCEQLAVRPAVRLCASTAARVPMVIGWLRPVILVPVGMATALTPQQLRAVLAHELAHVRRHDYLVNLVQAVFESLLFYHPAVWWLSNRLRVEREYCCDDVAVRLGGGALHYARALSSLETLRVEVEPALASTGGMLMHRIQRLLGVRRPSRDGTWVAAVVTTLGLALGLSAIALARPVGEAGTELDAPPALKQADLVAALREAGAAEADLFAALRDAGLDDRMLLEVLKRIDIDPEIHRAVEKALHRGRFIEAHLADVRGAISEDLAAGRIDEAGADKRLAAAHRKLDEHFAILADRHRERTDRALAEIREKLQVELEAGLITETEMAEKLAHFRAEFAERRALHETQRVRLRKLHEELKGAHEAIERKLREGLIDEAEAREHFEALRRKAHEGMQAARDVPPPDVLMRLHRIEREVEALLAGGAISQDEARARLDQALTGAHRALKRRGVDVDRLREHMRAIHEELRKAVAEGAMTSEEARQRLQEIHEDLVR